MIKATRNWGGKMSQGKAFGILDGGRGLVAAGVASIAVILFSNLLSGNEDNISSPERVAAFKVIIYMYTALTIGTALLVWLIIPETKKMISATSNNILKGVKSMLRNRAAWLQAIIVVCAYCGYKGLDYYSLYGTTVLDMNEVEAARFISNASYLRVVGAIGAGLIADRLSASKVIWATFLIMIICYLVLSFLIPDGSLNLVIMMNIIVTFTAVYALRGVYFALLEETNIVGSQTGTAVGLISLVGYTPDVFFNSIAGRILDASPGLPGFQNYFLMLAIFSIVGLGATLVLSRVGKTKAIIKKTEL
jgi:nitrate/nitrite transporter NarK